MKRKELIIIVILIFITALAVLFGMQNKAEAPVREGDATENIIEANNQSIGETASIEEVSLAQSGYVVLHRSVNGFPMDIVGVSELFTPGVYAGIAVPYAEDVADGEELIVLIHADNGDGIFSPADDISVLDDEGVLIKSAFELKR